MESIKERGRCAVARAVHTSAPVLYSQGSGRSFHMWWKWLKSFILSCSCWKGCCVFHVFYSDFMGRRKVPQLQWGSINAQLQIETQDPGQGRIRPTGGSCVNELCLLWEQELCAFLVSLPFLLPYFILRTSFVPARMFVQWLFGVHSVVTASGCCSNIDYTNVMEDKNQGNLLKIYFE